MKPIIRYFSKIRRFVKIGEQQRQLYLWDPETTFVRKSPLTFTKTITIIADLARQTLAIELAKFFRFNPQDIVTKSAFCQRRKHIKPAFFRDLFFRTSELFYTCFPDHKRWKGKRLLAVDGTGQALPHFPWLGRVFGTHLNQHDSRPSLRLLITHDVLNNIINRVDLHNQNVAEIVCAYRNVPQAATDAIYIYDRHYASFALAYLHFRHGSDFVIRMKTEGGSTTVRQFLQSAKKQQIVVTALHTGRAFYKLQELGLNPERHAEFTIRLIRVDLDDGSVEVLMTSLLDHKRYPHRKFKWLYSKRWGVETTIFILKSFLQIALFSAYTQPGVEQDLWATFAFYNQQSALITACEDQVKKKTGNRKYGYQINRNVTAGLIAQFLPDIYLCGRATWRARTLVLLKLMPSYTEPYRPNRSRARERKIMRMNNRHIHEKNYRKAM